MKIPYIKILGLIVVVMAAGLIFMSIKTSQKYKFRKSAKEIHSQLLNGNHLVDPGIAFDLILTGQ